MAYVDRDCNKIIAYLPGVKLEIKLLAEKIKAKAEALLALHYYEGHAKIVHTRGKLDHFISLVDAWAGSIEYGHWQTDKAGRRIKFIEGLFIIHKAAGFKGTYRGRTDR